MASLQATRKSEDPAHDVEDHHEDHVGLTTEASEYDVNRNLDMRRASFHPNRADILQPNADEKLSILGKLMGVLCPEGGTPEAGDKVEAPAAAGAEDASSHPAFENLSNKLKDKAERVHLLGEKGVRTHPDSAFPKGEDTADSENVDSETGFQNLKGELGKVEVEVEDSRSPPSGPVQCHTVVDPIPGYVADIGSSLGEPEFADASSTLQQSSEGVGSYAGPRVGDEARVEEKEEMVNLEQGKDIGEDAHPLGLHESGHNGEEFADAPSAFQQTYGKTIESTGAETEAHPDVEEEKETVWSKNSSAKQDEGRHGLEHSISSSSALNSSDEVEDLAKVPVSSAPSEIVLTQQESDKDLGELTRDEFAVDMEGITAGAPSAVPQFYDEDSEGAGVEGESHPGIKEGATSAVETEADVEDEAKPGLFSRVKQTLWSNSPSSTQELERESSSSSSSSFEEVSSAAQEGDLPRQKDYKGISAPLAERVLFPSDDSEENDEKYPDTVTEKEQSDLSQALDEKLALKEDNSEQGDAKDAERDENLSGQDEKTSTETETSPSFLGSIGKKIGLSGSKRSSDGSQAVAEKPTLKDETRQQGDAEEAASDENLSEQDDKTPSDPEKTSSFLGTIGKKIGLSRSKSMSEVDKRPSEQVQESPSEQQESSGLFSNIASKIGFSGSARSSEEETD